MKNIIRKYQEKDLDSLNILLNNVYKTSRKGSLSSSNIELVAINLETNEVIGYLVLNKLYNNIENKKYGYINYVCVLQKYRRQGVATKLFKYLFEICKDENITYLELTSNKSRIAAHKLYDKLEFRIRNTDVFIKNI